MTMIANRTALYSVIVDIVLAIRTIRRSLEATWVGRGLQQLPILLSHDSDM